MLLHDPLRLDRDFNGCLKFIILFHSPLVRKWLCLIQIILLKLINQQQSLNLNIHAWQVNMIRPFDEVMVLL